MNARATSSLAGAFRALSLNGRPTSRPTLSPTSRQSLVIHDARPFSATAARSGTWLIPNLDRKRKMQKGRARVATGGSTKGTTVAWGDYGLRMVDHHRRISAKQLEIAEKTIKQRLRGEKFHLYKRVACNVGVFVSGNEIRMGKGKGSFDHWATRVAVNQIVFELRGLVHEKIVRDAFRLASNKLPGTYVFVMKGEEPFVGITQLGNGVTLDDLKRPRRKIDATTVEIDPTATTSDRKPLDMP